jgi:hypothetical protein
VVHEYGGGFDGLDVGNVTSYLLDGLPDDPITMDTGIREMKKATTLML